MHRMSCTVLYSIVHTVQHSTGWHALSPRSLSHPSTFPPNPPKHHAPTTPSFARKGTHDARVTLCTILVITSSRLMLPNPLFPRSFPLVLCLCLWLCLSNVQYYTVHARLGAARPGLKVQHSHAHTQHGDNEQPLSSSVWRSETSCRSGEQGSWDAGT